MPAVVNSGKENAELQLERTALALKSSEERNQQLVRVTQAWSEECREKDNLLGHLQKRVGKLEEDRNVLLAKYTKAKQMLASSNGAGDGDSRLERQYEELRTELFERKDVHDKVCHLSKPWV